MLMARALFCSFCFFNNNRYDSQRHGDCVRELRECTVNSLIAANQLGVTSIAIPAISSGIFGFPKPLCAKIMINACLGWLREAPATSSLRQIKLCNFDEETVSIFQKEADQKFGSFEVVEIKEDKSDEV